MDENLILMHTIVSHGVIPDEVHHDCCVRNPPVNLAWGVPGIALTCLHSIKGEHKCNHLSQPSGVVESDRVLIVLDTLYK
jgi:hypothetical protein